MNIQSLIQAKQACEKDLLSKKNVVGVAVGNKFSKGRRTGDVAIVVYVTKKGGKLSDKDMIPAEINGVPTDVIEATWEPKTNKMAVADLEAKLDTGTYDPLEGGISIGPCRSVNGFVFVGTLGCVVTDNTSGDKMLLTNHHVAALDSSWSVGDTMTQPSRVDTGSCPADVVGTLQRAVINTKVDGAVISHDARGITCKIAEIGEVRGTATANVGDKVRKRGRTTELTYGIVDAVAASVQINYDPSIGTIVLTDQIIINADTTKNAVFGQGGDSGSVVVNEDDKVVGLYFAGNGPGDLGVANPIAAVESELDVKVYACKKKLVPDHKLFKEGLKEFQKEFQKETIKELIKEDLKEFVKEHLKDIKEKEWKEKEFKEKERKEGKDFKEKDKDIYEGGFGDPGGRLPGLDRPIPNLPELPDLGRRLAQIEQTLAGLQHFIASSLRPELSGSPLAREHDVDHARIAELQRELYGRSESARAAKDAADTPGRQY